jgi:hypothetical protein
MSDRAADVQPTRWERVFVPDYGPLTNATLNGEVETSLLLWSSDGKVCRGIKGQIQRRYEPCTEMAESYFDEG